MFKHRKLFVFTVLVMTLILSIGALSAADDNSTSNVDNSNVHTASESITNENIVPTAQDNNIEQSTPKSIKTDTDNTIRINKDNYQQQGWVKEDDEDNKFALSYDGEENPGNITFIFEDSIDENLNSIALLFAENIVISSTPDVEFNNVAFTLEGTNNVTLRDLKINIDDNYVCTGIYNPNIIHVNSESDATTIDNVYVNYYLPETVDIPKPTSVLDLQSNADVINSEFIIKTYTTNVDWDPVSPNYGVNQIMPIRSRNVNDNTVVNFINNTIYINATDHPDGDNFPTLYAVTFGTPYSTISNNNIEIHGTGWLYAINIKADYCNVTDNYVYVTGTNYTGGIFIEDYSYNLVDNNTLILEAGVERIEGAQTEPVTYGIVINNYAYQGARYREGIGHVINNTITNNHVTCTANNMYGIEQFGGDNTTIINNTMVITGETAMGIGVIGANTIIADNIVTVNGTNQAGVTVDYLSAKTTGILTARGYNSQITGNIINSTFTGMQIEGEHDDIISDNVIITPYDYTINLVSTNNTILSGNYLVAGQLIGDESINSNTQTNIIEGNLPEPELIETEIIITTDVAEEIEINDLIDIEGYFTANGVKTNFDSIEIFDNGRLIEIIDSWDTEGAIYYTYDAEEAGEHELSFVFNGNDTHTESETTIAFNVYDPYEKMDSFIDFTLDSYVDSGEDIEINALLYALDDETPISDAVVLIKVIINDEVVSEDQTTTDEEGWIISYIDTTGLSGNATVQLIFEGNDRYNSIYTDENIIINPKPAVETLITVDVESPINSGDEMVIDGIILYTDEEDNEYAVSNVPVTLKITLNETILETTLTTDEEGMISYTFDTTNINGNATVELIFEGNNDYLASNDSTNVEIIPKQDVLITLTCDDEYEIGYDIELNGKLTLTDNTAVIGQTVKITITYSDNTSTTIESTPTDNKGSFTATLPANILGETTITASITDNPLYNDATKEITTEIIHKQFETLLTIDTESTINSGEELIIDGIILYTDEEDNEYPVTNVPVTLKITLNETILETTLTTDEEGMISYTFDTTNINGNATVELIFEGNNDYLASNDSTNVEIVKVRKNVVIDGEIIDEYALGEEIVVSGTLSVADEQTPVAGKNVEITVTYSDGQTQTVTITSNDDGSFAASFSASVLGSIQVSIISAEDDDYLGAQTELTSTVNKIATILDVNILSSALDNVTIAVNVYDEEDNPITQGSITIKDSEGNLLLTVELDSQPAIINIPVDAEGEMKIMVEYVENDMYLPGIYINQSALETPDEYFVVIEVKGYNQESVVTLDDTTIFINNNGVITATVTDSDGNEINSGIVEFIDGEGNILGQANVENGVASIEVLYTEEITTQLTANYISDSSSITNSSATATLTVKKATTVIEIDELSLNAGETINLTARVYDEAGNNITIGKVVFKVNGKTVKDANGKVIYAKVVNGVATIEYTIPDELAGAEINITAAYNGNSKISGANTTITATVNTKEASLTLTSPEEVQVGSTVTFNATINDNNVVNTGKIVFKINGKTLKDENGKVIYAKIVNNVASIEYTIPESMKAKSYNLTAVLLSDEYDKLEATNEIKITN